MSAELSVGVLYLPVPESSVKVLLGSRKLLVDILDSGFKSSFAAFVNANYIKLLLISLCFSVVLGHLSPSVDFALLESLLALFKLVKHALSFPHFFLSFTSSLLQCQILVL